MPMKWTRNTFIQENSINEKTVKKKRTKFKTTIEIYSKNKKVQETI